MTTRITLDTLIEALETSTFLMPEAPGRIDHLRIPGIRGHISAASHPLMNVVGDARLADGTADATVARVVELFARENKPFSWMIGPGSTPTDLGARLNAAGLPKVGEMAGMVIEDMDAPIRINADVRIEEATLDEMSKVAPLLTEAFGFNEEDARFGIEAVLLLSEKFRHRGYLAYLPEDDSPVAFGAMLYLPDKPVVLLSGAGTANRHRGNGIYTSLVARRLADARADGIAAAIIQADRSTSAPICARLGFREICNIDLHVWMPH